MNENVMSDMLIDIQQGATAKELSKTYKMPLSMAKDFLKSYYGQKKGPRKEEVKEETEKISIVEVQVSAFKKKQELSSKIEEVRQFKSTINSKITKKTSIKETTETELSTVKEELKVIEANIVTYEEQLKNTKIVSEQKIIEKKIENIKKENETTYTTIEKLNKTIETITTDLEDLTSGKVITEKEESIKTLEKEVIKIN